MFEAGTILLSFANSCLTESRENRRSKLAKPTAPATSLLQTGNLRRHCNFAPASSSRETRSFTEFRRQLSIGVNRKMSIVIKWSGSEYVIDSAVNQSDTVADLKVWMLLLFEGIA